MGHDIGFACPLDFSDIGASQSDHERQTLPLSSLAVSFKNIAKRQIGSEKHAGMSSAARIGL